MRRLNDGHGRFGAPLTTAICPAAQVELADITTDGTDFTPDGRLDAVVFCTDSGAIARMAGDGAGGFGAPHPSAFLNSPPLVGDHFALGDITDYPRVKLLMYHSQDGGFQGLACALYDYNSDLDCLTPTGVGGEMLTADLGGDGHEELVMLGGAKGLTAFGIVPPVGGTSRSWTSVGIAFGKGLGESGNHNFAFGDLHADGRTDIATSWSTSSVGWVSTVDAQPVSLSSSAAREFPSVAGISKLITGDFADAAAADVDRNGTADAVVLDTISGQFEVLRNLAPPPVAPGPGGGPAPGPGPGPGPLPATPPTPPAPKPKLKPFNGVTRLTTRTTAAKNGTVTLGRAANPPTRAVAITLTVPGKTAGAGASATKRPKAVTVGRATVAIPAGKSRALTVRLTAKGRSLLRRRSTLRLTVTLVATASDGTTQTRTRTLTIKRPRS